MVGPNFRSPDSPKPKRYTETSLPAKTASSPGKGGASQTFVNGVDIPAAWWELFHSRDINSLVRAGLAHNPDLATASAALRVAQENYNVQFGNLMLPAVDASGYVQRQRFTAATYGDLIPATTSIFNLYNASVNVSYTLDVWGGSRRQLEALRAQIDYQQFELVAAYLTLTSNIVTTAISIASYDAQIKATIQLITAQQGLLDIFNKQYQLGGVSIANVLTQRTLVEQTRATLPPLQKSLSLSKHAMSVLVGTLPDGPLPTINLNSLHLPTNLPVSFPSKLVRQRPDVRAAEALVHAACAQIGVATANLLPQFTLTGTYGWTGSHLADLFTDPNKYWSIMGQVLQPIFHGGALTAQRRANIAAYRQAAGVYRKAVLVAFQNVADSLRALETDARTLRAQINAENAALSSLGLNQEQYKLGGVSYINLLNAQQQYQQTVISRIQAQAARYSDTAALFQSLGGGWWNKPWCVKASVSPFFEKPSGTSKSPEGTKKGDKYASGGPGRPGPP